MYDEENKHCKECICSRCELRGTKNCIEGKKQCDNCKNEDHAINCCCFDEED